MFRITIMIVLWYSRIPSEIRCQGGEGQWEGRRGGNGTKPDKFDFYPPQNLRGSINQLS